MKKQNLGEKFNQVLEQMKALEEKKKDIYRKPSQISATDRGVHIEELGHVDFTKTGLQSFCTKLDLPSSYMAKLASREGKTTAEIEFDMYTFKNNIERGLRTFKKDDDMLFRTYTDGSKNRIRAVFTEKYNVTDNLPILEKLRDFDMDQLETKTFNVSSDFMDLRFTMPHLKRTIGKLPSHEQRYGMTDDIVFPAIHLRNSETGKSKILIQFIIYRLVCTNGLVNEKEQYKVVNKKHMGEFDLTDINNRLAEITTRIPDVFEQYVEYMKGAKESIVEQPEEVFERLAKRATITKRMVETVSTNWMTEQRQERTKHAVINAITAGARDWEEKNKDTTGRLNLEEVAGELLFAKSL